MQDLKELEIPNYLIVGLPSLSIIGIAHEVVEKQVVSLTPEELQDLVGSRSSRWRSLTVFKINQDPVVDYSEEELYKYRSDLAAKELEKRQYELYLRLKAKFEPEELK